MRARPRRGPTSAGPTRPASQPTTASSTTVTATAEPRRPRAKIARVSPTRITAATNQRIPLVCSRYGSGGAAPLGRRRRGDRTASGCTGRALVGLERSAGTSMGPSLPEISAFRDDDLVGWVLPCQGSEQATPSAGCSQPPSWLTEQQAPPEREGGGQPTHEQLRHTAGNRVSGGHGDPPPPDATSPLQAEQPAYRLESKPAVRTRSVACMLRTPNGRWYCAVECSVPARMPPDRVELGDSIGSRDTGVRKVADSTPGPAA